jgi:HemX protein
LAITPTALGYTTSALYCASLVFYLRRLFAGPTWTGRVATVLLAAGLVTHYLTLLERAHFLHAVPYQDLYGSMSLLSWFLASTYLGLELLHRERAMGAFVLPLVLILLTLELVIMPQAATRSPAHGSIFALHVTSNILAYSAFTLSFVYSLIYLVQDRLLRGRRPAAFVWRLPALEDLERMTRSGVWVGLCALLLGMGFGMAVDQQLTGQALNLDPKVLVSFFILFCYAAYLVIARSPAWRGARASFVCVASYCMVVFSYTVVNLYLSSFHRFN